jgi:hypothetical protein
VTKFSVLVPTRNRVEYLQQAVASVLSQDYSDWEICIADNASSDLTRDWVAGLDDPRILYCRCDEVLPVTHNWNRSLSMSSGEYVVMLGDDDGLLQGYFASQERVIEDFGHPDAVYSKGLLYSYPGVIPGRPAGSLQSCGVAEFMAGESDPTLMSQHERKKAVSDALRFRMSYPFNMQLALLSRKLIDRMGLARFFQSPYPDYFAMNRILVEAHDIVKVPSPLVAVGATKKSFGYFYFNGAVSEGVDFLQNRSSLEANSMSKRVAGTEHLDSWRLALERLLAVCPQVHATPDYRRYRRMRFGNLLQQLRRDDSGPVFSATDLWHGYPRAERLMFSAAGWMAGLVIECSPRRLRHQARRVVARVGRELARETTWSAQPELLSGLQSMSEVVARVTPSDFGHRTTDGQTSLDSKQL